MNFNKTVAAPILQEQSDRNDQLVGSYASGELLSTRVFKVGSLMSRKGIIDKQVTFPIIWLMYSSSCCVYGDPEKLPIEEGIRFVVYMYI